MRQINLKMGEYEITNKPNTTLAILSLGSCIGFAVYDKKTRLAAMAHIVLPDSSINNGNGIIEIGKYADTAVPGILDKMLALGSRREDLIIKIAGGANMFNLGMKTVNALDVGKRNTEAVVRIINAKGLPITRAATGGNQGRTIKLNVVNGHFTLKVTGQEEIEF